jgi:hypothetical protein
VHGLQHSADHRCRDQPVTSRHNPATFFSESHPVIGSMTIKLGLLATALLVAACGAPGSSSSGSTSPHASASASSSVVMGTRQALGITAVYMAPAVAVDGSAEGGRDTFDSSKNRETSPSSAWPVSRAGRRSAMCAPLELQM